jgi:hypothetical protein
MKPKVRTKLPPNKLIQDKRPKKGAKVWVEDEDIGSGWIDVNQIYKRIKKL